MPGDKLCDPIAETVAALEHTPVGPELAAALAPLDPTTLTGSQVVDLLKARYRQANHERAQLFAVITEAMRRTEAETVVPQHVWPVEFAADEIRAALVLTRTAAEGLCSLAQDVARRLPAVQAAFAAGVLDQPRVRVFSLWTLGLSDQHTEAIVAALLPKAHQLTTAQLIHQIQRHAIALDPDWARRRYERALRGRRVVGRRNEDGTANLCGYDLPTDQVAAACDRLDRLAKAAKQAGPPDPIDHLRADLFLGMTDGTFEGLTDPQILHRLLTQTNPTQPPHDQPSTNQPGGDQPTTNQPGGDQPGDEASDTGPADDEAGGDEPGEDEAGDEPGAGEAGGDVRADASSAGGAVSRTAGLRLLVGLATVAGADQRPGELIGSGPVHAELARTIATAPNASWWYVLAGPDGAPLAIGRVRARPEGTGSAGRGYSRVQVWLQVNQGSLDALAQQSHPPGWDRVIAEITAKSQAGANAGPPNGDPAARLPGAALRRWLQVRDRTCVFPGCRVPAHRTDADHSVEHAAGGETIDTNLGQNCRHDHRLRHEGGWTITHTRPGNFTWRSRLGHTYHRQPPPDLADLPQPMPRSGGDEDDADDYADPSTEDWHNSTCMEPERPQPPAPPPPPPPASPEDDPPPF